MERLFFNTMLLLIILSSSALMAQTYRSCTEGGGCNTYNTGGTSTGGGIGGRATAPSPGGIGIKSSSESRIHEAKKCHAEKSRIEQENANCLHNVATDGFRETGRCNNYMNREVTGGAGIQHRVIFLNAEYTVQNPTYDKCINQVNAAVKMGDAYCGVINARNIGAARSANNGFCAKYFP